MLKKRREYHLELNELVRYRVWSAISNTFMQGLVCAEMPSSPASVEEFLMEYRFESPTDEEDRGSGITPLMLSSMAGNVEVVHELTRRHRVNLNARTRVELPELMLVKGVAALHAATLCSREQTHAVVTALLAAGADPNVASTAGGGTMCTTERTKPRSNTKLSPLPFATATSFLCHDRSDPPGPFSLQPRHQDDQDQPRQWLHP